MTIKALIIDDEPLARERLRDLLGRREDVTIAGEAAGIAAAAELIAREKPDVLFLDIVMPKGSGIELLKKLDPRPAVIFTTAHSRYAVTAFDENAVDYLVKPVSTERLELAISRLRRALLRQGPREKSGGATLPRRIAVRNRAEVVFVTVDDITWIGAEGNYCRVYTNEASYLVRGLIHHVASRLDPAQFIRIHRSAIVNVSYVWKVVGTDARGRFVVLRNGSRVRVGISYDAVLEQLLDGAL